MRRFLVALSGARSEILEKCPTERGKFEGIGGAVLTTSVLATISMWFALYSALGVYPLLAVPMAVIWGLAIMSLDRWLVGSIPAEGGRRWRFAVPRLLMALLLGAVISTPLVLQIFHSEIDAQVAAIKLRRADQFLEDQQRGAVGEDVARWRKTVSDLERVVTSGGDVPLDPSSDPRVRSLTAQRDSALKVEQQHYKEWQCQLYGGTGCKKKGDGPLARASKADYDNSRQQVDRLNGEIGRRNAELSATDEASKQTRVQQAKDDLPKSQEQLTAALRRQSDLQQRFDSRNRAANGLLIRLQALDELAGQNFTLRSAQILLFLLFLLIECLPVTVKLMQRPGNYEKILASAKREELRAARGSYGLRSRFGSAGRGASVQEIFERSDGHPRPGERSRPTRPMPTPASSRSTAVDADEGGYEQTSPEDTELRRMDDIRDVRASGGSAASDGGGIGLFGDDDDY